VSGTFRNSGLVDIINWAGTLPGNFSNTGVLLDRTSVKIQAATRVGDSIRVEMPGYFGHRYQLQRSMEVGTGVWQDIDTAADGEGLHGTGIMLELRDADPPSSASSFYRVRVTALP
jgi:hypothetical protein